MKRLLEAYALYRNTENATHELVIVGEALWSNLAYQTELSQVIKSTVHFTGHLPIEELAKIMGAASIFTYVPYFEGFGIPLVEAMKCGTPILSGELTSLPEVAADAALYCNPFDVKDIAEKMHILANNSELRTDLSQKGLIRNKAFDWDQSAQIVWECILKSVSN